MITTIKTSFLTLAISMGLLFSACSNNNGGDMAAETDGTPNAEADMGESKEVMIDVENSKVEWSGTMVGMYNHEGVLKFKSGKIQLNGDKIVGGRFEVDMASMSATDENFNEEKTPDMLVGHLSSPDFFDVKNHPTAVFEISSVDGNTAKGTLIIRGNEGEEAVNNIAVSIENGMLTATGELTFNRTNYDVSFSHPAKEMVISDDIQITVELSAKI